MGYTLNTLPEDRLNFFGDKLPPLNGISKTDWWPTDEEFALLWNELSVFEGLEKVNEREIFAWFCDNFTTPKWTNDYSVPIEASMIRSALEVIKINGTGY